MPKVKLNLLCVAAHYSTQYENSENYLKQSTDESLNNYALFFNKQTQTDSIYPVFQFLEKDVNELLKSFEWKK